MFQGSNGLRSEISLPKMCSGKSQRMPPSSWETIMYGWTEQSLEYPVAIHASSFEEAVSIAVETAIITRTPLSFIRSIHVLWIFYRRGVGSDSCRNEEAHWGSHWIWDNGSCNFYQHYWCYKRLESTGIINSTIRCLLLQRVERFGFLFTATWGGTSWLWVR